MINELENKLNIILEERQKITPDVVLEGKTIFDVTGTVKALDTTDADATKQDILKDKVAYVKGERVVGEIPSITSSKTINLVAADVSQKDSKMTVVTYPAGDESSGTDTLYRAGASFNMSMHYDEVGNLIGLDPSKIKSGEKILNVEGNYIGLDTSDGNVEPEDIIKGKKAYSQGAEVIGTIEVLEDNHIVDASQVYIPESDPNTLLMATRLENRGVLDKGITFQLGASSQQVASAIGLASDVIKEGTTILGIEGTAGSEESEYNAKFQAPEGITTGLTPAKMLVSITSLDTSALTSTASLFNGCSSLESLPEMDLSNSTSLASFCYNCTNLVLVPDLYIPKCNSMSSAFSGCTNLTKINISGATRVETYADAFKNCHNLVECPNLQAFANTLTLTNMYRETGLVNADLHGMSAGGKMGNTSVTNMFYNCQNLESVSNFTARPYAWNYELYTDYMFYNCINLKKISNVKLSYIDRSRYMFYNCQNLTTIENCDFIAYYTQNSDYMFYNCRNLETYPFTTQNNTHFSLCSNGHCIFAECHKMAFPNFMNLGISNLYYGASRIFYNCKNIYDITINFTSKPGPYQSGQLSGIFEGCSNLRTVNISNLGQLPIPNGFRDCTNLYHVTFASCTPYNAASTYAFDYLFANCINLKTMENIVGYPYERTSSLNGWFQNCTGLVSITNIIINRSINLSHTFANCSNLSDYGTFTISNCNQLGRTFENCISLKSITNINTASMASALTASFEGCTNLTDLQAFDCSSMNNHYQSMIPFGTYTNMEGGLGVVLHNLVNIGGFINYGMNFGSVNTANNSVKALDITPAPNLSYESLLNVINGVYNLYTTYGVAEGGTLNYPQLIRMCEQQYAKLSETDIANVQAKGWNITVHTINSSLLA